MIEGILNELRNHKNAPSRLSSKRTKLTTPTVNTNDTSSNDENLLKSSSTSLLLENATQILDSQVLKKTPSNCIIDLCPIMNLQQSSASSSDENNLENSKKYLSISQNYQQNFQMINKPYDIQNYLNKKYFNQNTCFYPQQQQQQQQVWLPSNNQNIIDPSTLVYNNGSNYIHDTNSSIINGPNTLIDNIQTPYHQQQIQTPTTSTRSEYFNNYQLPQQHHLSSYNSTQYNNDYNNYSLYHQC